MMLRNYFQTSLNRLRGAAILDDRFDQVEPVFLAPPFTPEVVRAIRLISTRIPLKADEASRQLWQKENNAGCQAEYEALLPVFQQLPPPKRILEIGPGFGRSVVYFGDAQVHLYDANGTETKYRQKYYDRPPQWPDTSSFCGNLSLLRQVLAYNGVRNFTLFDAAERPLRSLPGPYDLIYGFYSIGFHWSLEFYLDDLDPLLHERTLFLCTLNKRFRSFPRLREYSTRILQCREIKKNAPPLKLLLLSRGELPEITSR
jgi:hypothetical protein